MYNEMYQPHLTGTKRYKITDVDRIDIIWIYTRHIIWSKFPTPPKFQI